MGPLLLLWLLAKECEKCRRRLSLAQAPSSACKSQGYYFSDREKKNITLNCSSSIISKYFPTFRFSPLHTTTPITDVQNMHNGKVKPLHSNSLKRIAVKSCSHKKIAFLPFFTLFFNVILSFALKCIKSQIK